MRPILTSQQMADSDHYTIHSLGVPGITLMERAAQSCVAALRPRLEPNDAVAVMVGAGNNGGDGLAVARLLLEAGYRVDTFLAFPEKPFSGDAATNHQRLLAHNPTLRPADPNTPLSPHYAWLVDALFGTGLNRPLEGRLADLVQQINEHPASVLAVDLPSGLAGSRTDIPGPAVQADLTVTFQAAKQAHAVTPAAALCGTLVVHPIGIELAPDIGQTPMLLEADDYDAVPRPLHAHKGTFGTLGIVGGFRGMEGAANLAASAALRFGVGKVRVLTNTDGARFHHDSVMVDHIDHYRDEYTALVIGPGLSRRPEATDAITQLHRETIPVVWDADGLAYLAHNKDTARGSQWVMTPHPGEAAMLLNTSTQDIQADRVAALHALGKAYPGGWIVLKGYRTLIRAPQGHWYACATGNPALATAGSGDVLSGMLGSLLAQGVPIGDAVRRAVVRHGMAADHWVRRHAVHSMLAEDIVADLKD